MNTFLLSRLLCLARFDLAGTACVEWVDKVCSKRVIERESMCVCVCMYMCDIPHKHYQDVHLTLISGT